MKPIDEMHEGETFSEYRDRYKGLGLTDNELDDKATEAWYHRRSNARLNATQSQKVSNGDEGN